MKYFITDKAFQHWTQTAKECFERGCRCGGCFYKDVLKSQPCQMKEAVRILVKKYGVPEDVRNKMDKIEY